MTTGNPFTIPINSHSEAVHLLEESLQGSPLLKARPTWPQSLATKRAYYQVRTDAGQVTLALLLLEMGRSSRPPQDPPAPRRCRRPTTATSLVSEPPQRSAPARIPSLPIRQARLSALLRFLSILPGKFLPSRSNPLRRPAAPSAHPAPVPTQPLPPKATPAYRPNASANSTTPPAPHQA